MPLVIPPGFMQIAIPHLHGNLARAAMVTIGAVDQTGTASAVEVVDNTVQTYLDNVGPLIDASVTIGAGIGTLEFESGGYATIDGTVQGAGGAAGANKVSPAVALLVKKNTDRAGRGGRGRMFVPWALDDDDVDEVGNIQGVQVAAYTAAFAGWISDAALIGLGFVILHQDTTPGGTVPTDITSFAVDARVGTQRRRQRG